MKKRLARFILLKQLQRVEAREDRAPPRGYLNAIAPSQRSLTAECIEAMPSRPIFTSSPDSMGRSFIEEEIFRRHALRVFHVRSNHWSAFYADIHRLGLSFLRNEQFALPFDLPLLYQALGHFPNLYLKYAPILATNRYAVHALLEQRGEILHDVPEAFCEDPAMAYAFLTNRQTLDSRDISPKLAGNRCLFARLVTKNGPAIRFANVAIRSNPGIALRAIRNDWVSMQFLHHSLRRDLPFLVQAANVHPLTLRFAQVMPYIHRELVRAVEHFYISPQFREIEAKIGRLASQIF